MYEHDNRTVMTLDAGGTNFVFSAIRGCKQVVESIRLDAVTDSVARCLEVLTEGFNKVKAALDEAPVAISFAFPGPADYKAGIIGDLPNFPCFRGGVPIGPYLAEQFKLPVFINNDGNLFAYGEALAGILPEMNTRLEGAGSSVRYKNLIGLTLGTGFGAGVVIDNVLLRGDNGCGGDVWLMRNVHYPEKIAEESVSIRAVKRVYAEVSGDTRDLTPKDIQQIADGLAEGDRLAAIKAFKDMGVAIADALAHALDIVDGLVVLGGGISNAHKYIIPSIIESLRGWLQMDVVDLTTEEGMNAFLKDTAVELRVPGGDHTVLYHSEKKTGIAVTRIGTSEAVSIGAYTYALMQLDK